MKKQQKKHFILNELANDIQKVISTFYNNPWLLAPQQEQLRKAVESFRTVIKNLYKNNPDEFSCLPEVKGTPLAYLETMKQWCIEQSQQQKKGGLASSGKAGITQGAGTNAAGNGGKKITEEEANVRARELIKENPNYTIRKLAEKIPCSIGLVQQLLAWRALQEYKKKMFGNQRPKVIPLTKELEACLGSKDEQLNQLIAEQEKEKRQDERQARLYLSHEKKPKRDNQ